MIALWVLVVALFIACVALTLRNGRLSAVLDWWRNSVHLVENRDEQACVVCEQWRVEKQELRAALEEASKDHEENADLYRCRTDRLFKTLHAVGEDLSNTQATVQKCFEILNGNRDEET